MRSISTVVCLAFFGLIACSASRHIVTDRRLSEEGTLGLAGTTILIYT